MIQGSSQNQINYSYQPNPQMGTTVIVYDQPVIYNEKPVIYNEKPYNPANPMQIQQLPSNNGTLLENARLNFIRKVFMILSVQLLITAGFIICSMYAINFFIFQLQYFWLLYVAIGIAVICQIPIFFCKAGQIYPLNFILLSLFTIAQAYVVSFICSATGKTSGNYVVLMAGIITLLIVVGATIYALTTREDFTTHWAIIIIVLLAFIFFGMFIGIFRYDPNFSILYDLYCCLGAIAFGIFLIIDIQLISGGHRYELSLDDYVTGALILYIDIIQILLFLLRIMGKKRR